MLEIKQVSFVHPGGAALSYDFSIAEGEAVALMGPSGSGKSTLIDLIAGFLTPAAGDILWRGESLLDQPPARRPVAALFQQGSLFAHLTVERNLAFALSPDGRLTDPARQQIAALLASFSMAGFEKRRAGALSGGQQQRAALARVILMRRPVLLLDEPFTALDAGLKDDVRAVVWQMMEAQQLTTLLVTHDAADAEALGARKAKTL